MRFGPAIISELDGTLLGRTSLDLLRESPGCDSLSRACDSLNLLGQARRKLARTWKRKLCRFASQIEKLVDVERAGRTKSGESTTGLDSSSGDSNNDRVTMTIEVGVGGDRNRSAKLSVTVGDSAWRYFSANIELRSCTHGSLPADHGSTEVGALVATLRLGGDDRTL